jgi:hypothetical protein
MRTLALVGLVLCSCEDQLVGDISSPVVMSDAGSAVPDGGCLANVLRCTETGLVERCSEDQLRWDPVEECVGPAFCDPSQGCVPEPLP